MSIVALKKITLLGVAEDKTPVLEGLQALGCVHLVPLRVPRPELETLTSAGPSDAYKALKYLLDSPRKRRPLHHSPDFDVEQSIRQTLTNQQRTRELSDRRDFLAQRIRDLEPWGDFALPPADQLTGFKLWFYIVPLNKLRQVAPSGLAWQVVYRDPRHAYVVVIAEDEPPADALPVPRTHTGSVRLAELRRQLEIAESALEDLAAERWALTRWLLLLAQNRAGAEDRETLIEAASQTLDGDGIFAVQGWLPTRDLARLTDFAEAHGLAMLAETPAPGDNPPTLLDNPPQLAGGQAIVSFYQTPGYRTWDPSVIVFFSFALFFAMILADAGYALAIGAALTIYWRRMGRSESGRRLRLLAGVVAAAALVYGVLVGSYFGVTPSADSLPGRLRLLDLDDFEAMMRLAVVIGCAHIVLANAIVASRVPHGSARLAPLGWIAVVSGGLALWLGEGGGEPAALLQAAGTLLVALGLGLILFFSDHRPVRSAKDALMRLLGGLQALTSLSRAFGDVMSYLRLFALGLASASLALTFNQLAGQVNAAVPGLGLVLSTLILVFGHTINLGLAVMSGVIHGLRLNFIEFFNWGLAEEGYSFRPFAKREIPS